MLKTSISLAILTILFIVIPTFADELPIIHNPPTKQEDSKTTDSKENTKAQNQNSTPPLTIINPTPSPPLQAIRENESPQYGKEQKSSWWKFSLTDALLVLFTCGLVIVGWLQVSILRGTLRETQRTADAANKAAQVAKDTLTSTRRAFVSLKQITAEPVMISRGLDGYEEAQHWSFNPCWVNMGDTPTKKLTISVNWKVFEYNIPNDFDFPYDNRPNATTNIPMAIGPKGEVICGVFALHYLRILDQIMGSQISNLYIWGKAIYNDIFDKPHCTRFCVKMLFLTQQIVGGHDKATFIFYDRYNCYDEDCDEQP